jgi:hypothetical protein
LQRFGILQILPPGRIFPKEDPDSSATLKAIRRAYASRALDTPSGNASPGASGRAYQGV